MENDDGDLTSTLEHHRLDIVRSLEPEKQFLQCYLRSKVVLDDEDCERINNGATRQERAAKMLDILSLKGPDAAKHFVDALEFENPRLYESVTGKTAESRLTPVPHEIDSKGWDWTTGIDGKALIDFDRQFLAKQLSRAVEDLKNMTYLHSKIIEEKNLLERKLFEAADDLQSKEKCMKELKEEIVQLASNRKTKEVDGRYKGFENTMRENLQLRNENMEMNRVIIMLQGKLLSTNEKIDHFKSINGELLSKNETFKTQIRELTIINDYERKNSLKISESVTEQKDELNRELYKWKFKYAILAEEKEGLQQELDSFQKWTEILNSRFDALSQEKNSLQDTSEDLSSRFQRLQDYISELEAKETWQNFNIERAKNETSRLAAALEIVRVDRDKLMRCLQETKSARDEAEAEKTKAAGVVKSLQLRHEADMKEQRMLFGDLSNKHMHLLKELALMEQRALVAERSLKSAELALESKKTDQEYRRSHHSSSSEKLCDMEDPPKKEDENAEEAVQNGIKSLRNRGSLIESIRRKLTGLSDESFRMRKGSSLPSNFCRMANQQLLDFEQILIANPASYSPKKAMTLPSLKLCQQRQSFYEENEADTNSQRLEKTVTDEADIKQTIIAHLKADSVAENTNVQLSGPFRSRCYCVRTTKQEFKTKRSKSVPEI